MALSSATHEICLLIFPPPPKIPRSFVMTNKESLPKWGLFYEGDSIGFYGDTRLLVCICSCRLIWGPSGTCPYLNVIFVLTVHSQFKLFWSLVNANDSLYSFIRAIWSLTVAYAVFFFGLFSLCHSAFCNPPLTGVWWDDIKSAVCFLINRGHSYNKKAYMLFLLYIFSTLITDHLK